MVTQLLDEAVHLIDNFDCGNESLNTFLKRYATRQQKKWVGRTFVISNFSNEILGFYTLSSGSIRYHEAPPLLTAGLPKYPIPTVVLGRLAVHKSEQGTGLGKILLKDALKRVLAASENLGIVAIVVHAKDQTAANFYKKYGFIPFKNEEKTLFLQTKTLISSNKKTSAFSKTKVEELV